MKTQKDVDESLSSQHEKEKEINRAYLRKVLENNTFYARQGLPMKGTWVSPSPNDSEGRGSDNI